MGIQFLQLNSQLPVHLAADHLWVLLYNLYPIHFLHASSVKKMDRVKIVQKNPKVVSCQVYRKLRI